MNLYFQIYGSAYNSTTGNLAKGGYIGSSTITIRTNSNFQQHSFKITNSSGTVVATSSATSVTAYNLTDGIYYMTYTGGSEWHEDTNIRRHPFATTITATTNFRVDLTAPTISGAALTTTGKVVNSAFTVVATDSGLGVDSMYMKGPNDSGWMSCGSSKTVAAGSTNGLYQFYAKDLGGNSSATYYVYLDTAKPSVSFYTSDVVRISNGITNVGFFATATDSGLGVDYMQYKRPSDTFWQTYTAQTAIENTSENGIYMFRAVDKAGNICDTYLITLDSVKPTVTIYGGTNTVSNAGSTKADYIKFVASDTISDISAMYVKLPNTSSYTAYSSGTQYTTNGKYYFYCVDSAGNQSDTYSITLDNAAPVMSCSQTDFYTTTEYDFTVRATDNASIAYLYCKTPLMTEFERASSNSYSVMTTDSDGKYYFYAMDSLGNKSETKWIELNVSKPTATIERDKNTNKYRITWDGSSTGRLNDNPYDKGTWIADEGEYTFVITNSSNRSNTYHFTIAHAFVVFEVVEPNCTERGYTIYKCLSCDITYNANYVDELGHDYDSVLVGESCTEGAYYLYTCKVCGHQYKSEYITQGGHKYTAKTTSPTCTERGYTTYTCSICGYSFRDDYTNARGHSYRTTVTAPTCTEVGFTHYECKNCDYEYDEDYIPAHGHNYETTIVEPTCTERGHTLHKCSYCGDEYKTDETLALGHNYTERTVEVSCTEKGCVRHTCIKCGYEYDTDVTPALGHKYISEVTRQVTCEEDGNRHHICTRCGDQYDTAIPHFGHTYEIIDETNAGGTVVRRYKCSVCGYSYTQDLGNQYEEVSSYVEYLFQQYSPYMIYVFLATSGVWSIAMGVAYIIARKNEEKEKAKKMLVNYGIGMIVIFVILVAAPLLVRGIAALIAG
ncbi:MAG: hypothetical protein IJ706_04845 [Clostridia bacterium]|nr:hypothetical protein [Clostridia bacterium]